MESLTTRRQAHLCRTCSETRIDSRERRWRVGVVRWNRGIAHLCEVFESHRLLGSDTDTDEPSVRQAIAILFECWIPFQTSSRQ